MRITFFLSELLSNFSFLWAVSISRCPSDLLASLSTYCMIDLKPHDHTVHLNVLCYVLYTNTDKGHNQKNTSLVIVLLEFSHVLLVMLYQKFLLC